jgi:hypothetical protein
MLIFHIETELFQLGFQLVGNQTHLSLIALIIRLFPQTTISISISIESWLKKEMKKEMKEKWKKNEKAM